jgi:hypothetical protein
MSDNIETNIATGRPTSWQLHRSTLVELKRLKGQLGVTSYESAIRLLIERYKAENTDTHTTANYEQVFNHLATKPVIISGKSGTGKTTATKEILKRWKGSLFVIDVHSEYSNLKSLDLGKFYSSDLTRIRARFVPNSNAVVAASECSAIFMHLLMLMHTHKLQNTVIVIEEGHRFQNDVNLRGLITEGRKFIKKFIVVCSDGKIYDALAPVLYPASR